jgi:hypothetical protein
MATVVTLLVAGALLILLETVLPGLIAGVAGFACVSVGVGLAYARFDLQTANIILLVVLIAAVVGAILFIKYFPN